MDKKKIKAYLYDLRHPFKTIFAIITRNYVPLMSKKRMFKKQCDMKDYLLSKTQLATDYLDELWYNREPKGYLPPIKRSLPVLITSYDVLEGAFWDEQRNEIVVSVNNEGRKMHFCDKTIVTENYYRMLAYVYLYKSKKLKRVLKCIRYEGEWAAYIRNNTNEAKKLFGFLDNFYGNEWELRDENTVFWGYPLSFMARMCAINMFVKRINIDVRTLYGLYEKTGLLPEGFCDYLGMLQKKYFI